MTTLQERMADFKPRKTGTADITGFTWPGEPPSLAPEPGGEPRPKAGGGDPVTILIPDTAAARKPFDPLKHPRDKYGRFTRSGSLAISHQPLEHASWTRLEARRLKAGDYLGVHKITGTEHGSAPHTTRLVFDGGGRITLRDDYKVTASIESVGGESFFSENKTLHKDDPRITDLAADFGDHLHVGEDGKGWDTAAVQAHLRELQEVPAAHRRFLAAKDTDVYVGTEPVSGLDDMAYLHGQRPAFYADTYPTLTYEDCAAAYFHGGGPVWSKDEPPVVIGVKPSKVLLGNTAQGVSVSTGAHESGHGLSYHAGILTDPAMQAIHDRFISRSGLPPGREAGMDIPLWKHNPYYRSIKEFTAETYAAWAHTRVRPSKFRAAEIMDAVGFVPVVPPPGEAGKTGWGPGAQVERRAALKAKREMGQALIALYDALDARLTTGGGAP